MLKWFSYSWRLFATGFSFAIFGIGGLILPLLFTPVIYLISRDAERRREMTRYVVHKIFLIFIHIMKVLGILNWRIEGQEKLLAERGLLLANHPSLLDVVFLVALVPNANCVVKGRLASNIAMRGFISMAGYITNDGGEALAGGVDGNGVLIIFPEGTRTTPGEPLHFQRGAANIALRSGLDITPVVMGCEPTTLTKQHRWYHIPETAFTISISVKDNIDITPYTVGPVPREARRLTKELEAYFKKELLLHDSAGHDLRTEELTY